MTIPAAAGRTGAKDITGERAWRLLPARILERGAFAFRPGA